jgi:hypothetical protein
MNTSQHLSLWQIGTEYQNLFARLYDQETGEINEMVEGELNALAPSAEKKCIAIASWIKNLEADKAQIEYMKEEILKREAAYQKKIDEWTNYLDSNMKRCKIKEIACPYFTIRIKTNPYSTDIEDETLIPEQFMKTREIVKVETKPDKNAIKEEVLRTGIQVPGALVHQKTKLQILTDKV